MQDKKPRYTHTCSGEDNKSYKYTHMYILQAPLLEMLLVALNAVAGLEVVECCKRDTALGVLAHLLDVLLLVLERVDDTCLVISTNILL